ncbi:MAG: Rv2231c family pyridoxal phosphate-dependent protein CobC [Nitriliruptor sp.]|uniref:Rv2231c family pyridoxal phosphate-dependent protein CobC n=1 Tax=Nitriliruptor sp. TaxID=2448056 RepID=UPI0034A01E87
MTTHLVLGGTSSGKSSYAETVATAGGAPVVCVATGRASDEEMAERIDAHRRRRPGHWRVDETTDIAEVLRDVAATATVVIDDLEGWLVTQMSAAGLWSEVDVAPLGAEGQAAVDRIVHEAETWWRLAAGRVGDTILIAGQPGVGIIPIGASVRRYVDVHGRVTQRLSALADRASLLVAGRALGLAAPAGSPIAGDRGWPDAASPGVTTLRDHGDRQVPPGALDLAVNVLDGPPTWLRERLAGCLDDLAGYPDDTAARTALAGRHGRDPAEIVVLAGAADGFWLLPRVLAPRSAACVHPGFTEAEAALRDAGVPVVRVQRDPETWRLDVADVPEQADLVVVGRPDNPTGIVDAESTIAELCRPGRTVVVDEAFAEFLPDATGIAARGDLPGLVVLRSFTKLWGLAGLRVGYLVAHPELAGRLGSARQPWAVDTLALDAMIALCQAEDERRLRAQAVADVRAHLLDAMRAIPRVTAWDAAANFVLLHTPQPDLRERLLEDGIAVRRGDTFPGLDAHYVRVAVRTREINERLAAAVARHLGEGPIRDAPQRSPDLHDEAQGPHA